MLSPSVLRVWFHTSAQAEDAQLSARLSYRLVGHLSNALEHFCSAVLALSREQLASPPSWALRLNQASLLTAALPIAAPSLCTTINSASPSGTDSRLGYTTEQDTRLRRFGPQ